MSFLNDALSCTVQQNYPVIAREHNRGTERAGESEGRGCRGFSMRGKQGWIQSLPFTSRQVKADLHDAGRIAGGS